jgi:hypothetical protein
MKKVTTMSKAIKYWRRATPSEIRFGYGTLHYCYFDINKKWFKDSDGVRWNKCV